MHNRSRLQHGYCVEVNPPKHYVQLRVKDLPKVLTWRLKWDSNRRPSGRKAPLQPSITGTVSFIHSFIQAISIRILCRSFTPKRHRQLRVKDLPRLEWDSNPRLLGRKATNLPMFHHAPQFICGLSPEPINTPLEANQTLSCSVTPSCLPSMKLS